MTTLHAERSRRLYRDRDRAILGGVCAGLAGYLDFNLKATRILTFIAFLAATPIAVVAYIAAVFLIPAASGVYPDTDTGAICKRRQRKRERKQRERQTVEPFEGPNQPEEQCVVALTGLWGL